MCVCVCHKFKSYPNFQLIFLYVSETVPCHKQKGLCIDGKFHVKFPWERILRKSCEVWKLLENKLLTFDLLFFSFNNMSPLNCLLSMNFYIFASLSTAECQKDDYILCT